MIKDENVHKSFIEIIHGGNQYFHKLSDIKAVTIKNVDGGQRTLQLMFFDGGTDEKLVFFRNVENIEEIIRILRRFSLLD